MKKRILIGLTIFGFALLLPSSVRYWPESHFRNSLLMLWYQDEILHLFSLAEGTPYGLIGWAERGRTVAWFSPENGGEEDYAPNIDELIEVALATNSIRSFWLVKIRGQWVWRIWLDEYTSGPDENGKYINLHTYYQYGGQKWGSVCSDPMSFSQQRGECHTKLLGDWILNKAWVVIED